ncbi:amino acid/amide ABC transporter membrane protein 2 (HAAT family) [Leucobacter komagatae]|uniref:Amino acid/amide ABC transporter membrane protein 2 (HAAT family) n=1 Tax=Leucobacter komagatae TaxID=55969 RepID=A0A542Y4X3_9MICO|nr:branched-chain amino acid ABC transporter permease [Leucobacter komagatae]TQL43115.1 amino acid/amide ABC transporter membrane protein 2 (HAAT family) [Leucobacter komagatae]
MTRFLPALRGHARIVALGAALTILAIGATFLLDPYRNFQFATIAAYFAVTAGLTLLVGQSGQLSLGHAALMATGGYGYALTANALAAAGLTGLARFLPAFAVAVVAAGALGLLLGLAAARLHGPYLAGITLALVVAVPAVATTFKALGGDQGLPSPYQGVPGALQTLIAAEQWHAWVAILTAGAVVTWLAILRGGPFGLRMRAVRDDETAARLNGVPAGRVKVSAFTVSAVAAGAGGAVLCFITQSVSPGAYTLSFSLLLVVAAVLGGLGSIGGAAIGSFLVVMLPWLITTATSQLPLSADMTQRLTGNLPVLIFGALLTVTILVRPSGIVGLIPRFPQGPREGLRSALRSPSTE